MFVLHGALGAQAYTPLAQQLVHFRVFEPFQRRSPEEPLTVARHVANLHELITVSTPDQRPLCWALSGTQCWRWAYAASHPSSPGALLLIGCGTFDPVARTEFERTIERMSPALRAEPERAKQLASDESLKAGTKALTPIYSYHPLASPHADDDVDARAHRGTWNDMLRLQCEGVYPAAFAISAPVLMVHGTFDPHPGRLICKSLQPYLPQLQYRELERCGYCPWVEKEAAGAFFLLVREWLGQRTRRPIQNWTVVPKYLASRLAVSGVMGASSLAIRSMRARRHADDAGQRVGRQARGCQESVTQISPG